MMKKKAIILARILYEKFGIKTFIDSCIWSYSNNLLKQIDNDYCRNINGKNYNYLKNNFTVAQII
jgi:hypothetical protein